MDPTQTLGRLLRDVARGEPDAPAFRYREDVLTYADWDRLADRLAMHFRRCGVGRGDVVALWLPSTPLYPIAYLAAARLGAVTTGINIRYRRHEVEHLLRQAGARVLLAAREAHGTDLGSILAAIAGNLPELAETIWIDPDQLSADTRGAVASIVGDEPGNSAVADVVDPDDPVAIVFTSGTTGRPKGAWYTHRNLMALAEIETRRYADGAIPFRKHLAAGLSFAHMGTMLRIAVQIGHRGLSIVHDTFDPAAVLETIERERLVHLGAIPTQMIMLLEHPDRSRRDLTSLRSILLGGAASSPTLIRRIAETFSATISVRYSSTEVGIATASLREDSLERLTTTVGRATPGVELRIVDPMNRPVPAGEIGEIVVRSPATMRGYWRAPEETAAVIDAEGWVHTGDAGAIDTDGYVMVQGRQSEMYIRGGFNVHPEEVERLLARHPDVERVAVVGTPDERLGSVGTAYVVPRDRERPPTLGSLREFVGAEMASFKRPDRLRIVEALPLTPMFKVDRAALRSRERE